MMKIISEGDVRICSVYQAEQLIPLFRNYLEKYTSILDSVLCSGGITPSK